MARELKEVIKKRCLAEPSAMYADIEYPEDPGLPPMLQLNTGAFVPATLVELWHGTVYHAAVQLKHVLSFTLFLDHLHRIVWERCDDTEEWAEPLQPFIKVGENPGLNGPSGYTRELLDCLRESTLFVNGHVQSPHVREIIKAAIDLKMGVMPNNELGSTLLLQDPVTSEVSLDTSKLEAQVNVRLEVLPLLDVMLGKALSERRLAFKPLSIVLSSTKSLEVENKGFDPEVLYKWDPDFRLHPQFTSLRRNSLFVPGDLATLNASYSVGSNYHQMLNWAYKHNYGELYQQVYFSASYPKGTIDAKESNLLKALKAFHQNKSYSVIRKDSKVTVIGCCTVYEVEDAASWFDPSTKPSDEEFMATALHKVSEATRMMPLLVLCAIESNGKWQQVHIPLNYLKQVTTDSHKALSVCIEGSPPEQPVKDVLETEGQLEHVDGDSYVLWFSTEEHLLIYLELNLGKKHEVCRRLLSHIEAQEAIVKRVSQGPSSSWLNSRSFYQSIAGPMHSNEACIPLVHPSSAETREVIEHIFACNRVDGACSCGACAGNHYELKVDPKGQIVHQTIGFGEDHYLSVRKLKVGVHCTKDGDPVLESTPNTWGWESNIIAKIAPVACAAYAGREAVLCSEFNGTNDWNDMADWDFDWCAFQILHPQTCNTKALATCQQASQKPSLPYWQSVHGWYQACEPFQAKTLSKAESERLNGNKGLQCVEFKPMWKGLNFNDATKGFCVYRGISHFSYFGGMALCDPGIVNLSSELSKEIVDEQMKAELIEEAHMADANHFLWEHISHVKVTPNSRVFNATGLNELSAHEISLHHLTLHPLNILCNNFEANRGSSARKIPTGTGNRQHVSEHHQVASLQQAKQGYRNLSLVKLVATLIEATSGVLLKKLIKNWIVNTVEGNDITDFYYGTKEELLQFMKCQLGADHKACHKLSTWLAKEDRYRKEATALGLHCPPDIVWFPLDTTYANGDDRIDVVRTFLKALQAAHNCTCEQCMQYNREPGIYNKDKECYEQAIRSCPNAHYVPVKVLECGIECIPRFDHELNHDSSKCSGVDLSWGCTAQDIDYLIFPSRDTNGQVRWPVPAYPIIKESDSEFGVKIIMNVIPVLCPTAKALGCQGSHEAGLFTSNAVQLLHSLELNTELRPKHCNATRHGAYQYLQFCNTKDSKRNNVHTCAMELKHRKLDKKKWTKVHKTSEELMHRDVHRGMKTGDIHFGGINFQDQDSKSYDQKDSAAAALSEDTLALNDFFWNHISLLRLRKECCIFQLQQWGNSFMLNIDDAHLGPIAYLIKQFKKQKCEIQTNLKQLQKSPQKSPQAIRRAAQKEKKRQFKLKQAIETFEVYIGNTTLAWHTYYAIRYWQIHLKAEATKRSMIIFKIAYILKFRACIQAKKDAVVAWRAHLYAMIIFKVAYILKFRACIQAKEDAVVAWRAHWSAWVQAVPAPPEAVPAPPATALALTIDSAQCDCPITMEIMRDPVIAADGHTYEREAIKSWLQCNNTSPMTEEVMPHTHLMPNYLILSIIQNSGLLASE